jgi:hypothetical protein
MSCIGRERERERERERGGGERRGVGGVSLTAGGHSQPIQSSGWPSKVASSEDSGQ